jgi:hypothetical protein
MRKYEGEFVKASTFMLLGEERSEEEKRKEEDVCPRAGQKAFEPDLARLCFNTDGHPCTAFRIKPFEKCPFYNRGRASQRTFRAHVESLPKKVR